MTNFSPECRKSELEGSAALRDFLNDLFEEQAEAMSRKTFGDRDSCENVTISLCSDEETTNSTDDLTKSSRSLRRNRSRKAQRPKFSVSPDNAAGVQSGRTTELMVSSYHNPLNKSRQKSSRNCPLSASAHSLGSRTGISSTSVGNWRNSLHKHRKTFSRQDARKNHKDSRWSTSPLDIPNNSRNSRVKQYDLGFVNDSMHVRKARKSKTNQQKNTQRLTTINSNLRKNNRKTTCSKAIDRAVSVVSALTSSDDDSSDGEEFFEDDEESLSSFTESFVSSQATVSIASTKAIGSSLDFGSRYKTKAKAIPTPSARVVPSRTKSASARVVPSRTKSGGDLPKMPRRTKDDSSFKVIEEFEPLKGNSSSHHTSFEKTKVRRTMSDDVSTMSKGSRRFESARRRITDPFGRWAATIGNKKDSIPKNSNLRLPRRIPSLSSRSKDSSKKAPKGKLLKSSNSSTKTSGGSIHRISSRSLNRSTGRYSNHSNDSSEASDSDSETCDFHNSFAHDDDSLTATMATTDSSKEGGNTSSSGSSSYDQDEAYKFLFQPPSSHRRGMSIPESFRKLPLNSFHESSTISTKASTRKKHPGKSLRTASIGHC